MFIDTHKSGVSIRYRVLDDKRTLILSGTEKEASLDGGVHVVFLELA